MILFVTLGSKQFSVQLERKKIRLKALRTLPRSAKRFSSGLEKSFSVWFFPQLRGINFSVQISRSHEPIVQSVKTASTHYHFLSLHIFAHSDKNITSNRCPTNRKIPIFLHFPISAMPTLNFVKNEINSKSHLDSIGSKLKRNFPRMCADDCCWGCTCLLIRSRPSVTCRKLKQN